MLKKYAYAWITLAFFTVSIALHWGFGWLAYVDDQTCLLYTSPSPRDS